MRDGQFVSAGSPDVWDVERVGTTFNARVDGDALKLEAWVDPAAVERAGDDARAVMAAIEDGERVEVSTAAWVDEVPRMGALDGRKYEAVQINFQPDHMAILPMGQVGACSWEDGCGVRVNVRIAEEARQPMVTNANTTDGTGVTLTDGTGTAVQPSILSPQPCDCGCHERPTKPGPAAQQTAGDRGQALQIAIEQTLPDGVWAMVFDHDDDNVYFARDDEPGIRRRSFTEDGEGTVTLGDDEDRVRPRTDFVAVQVAAEQLKEDGEMADDKQPVAATLPPDTVEGDPPKTQERQLANALAEVDHLRAQLAKRAEPETEEDYIAQAPDKMRTVMFGLLKAQRRRELEQIEVIKGATDQWTEDELRAMDPDQLDKVASLAKTRGGYDYSVVAGEQSRLAEVTDEDENYAALPPSPWDVAPAGQA
jgi:hypothetical protein